MQVLLSPQAPTWGMFAMNLNTHLAGSQGFNTSALSTTAGTAAAGMGCAVRQWTRLVAQHSAPCSPVRAGAALQPLTLACTMHGKHRTVITPPRLASPAPLSRSSAAVSAWGTRPALWAHPQATRTVMTATAGGTVDSMSSGSTSTVRSVLGGGGGDLSKGKGVDLSSLHGRHVAVVGGGVIGLATAMRALQAGAAVTVVAAAVGGATTSAGAAGLWAPYKLSDTPEEAINRWAGSTHAHLTALRHSRDAVAVGVAPMPAYWLHTVPQGRPSWSHLVDHHLPLPAHQLVHFNRHALPSSPWVEGWYHETLICEGALYLAWQQHMVEALGGRILLTPDPLTSLDQVAHTDHHANWVLAPPVPDMPYPFTLPLPHPASPAAHRAPPYAFDAIANCCGLGAGALVGDNEVSPIRGQVVRVEAPWVTDVHMAPELGVYVIPNRHCVVLGGTAQVGDWSTEARETDRERILAGCTAMVPSLAHAKVLTEWVGLRPGRTAVRLELEESPAHGLPTVHNYGHGGAGLTLAWGCAGDAVELLAKALA